MFPPRPVLISGWSNRVVLDALAAMVWPASTFVIQPDNRSVFHNAFFSALANRDVRLTDGRAAFGRSVLANLHPVAVETLSRLIGSNNLHAAPGKEPGNRSDMSCRLANWLKYAIADSGENDLAKTVPYIFTSGAQRARIIATVLAHLPHGRIERLVDIGSAVGAIPWLLQHDLPSLQATTLVEPMKRFRAALDRLWQNGPCSGNYTVIQTKAEEAKYDRADLIMLSHCFFLIAPEKRQAAIQRAWAALNAGGILLVNEVFKDASIPNPSRPDLMHRDELFGMMPHVAGIFTRRTGWRKPQKLSSVTARIARHTSIIFAVKNGRDDPYELRTAK